MTPRYFQNFLWIFTWKYEFVRSAWILNFFRAQNLMMSLYALDLPGMGCMESFKALKQVMYLISSSEHSASGLCFARAFC